jgi:peptidoglycan-associated lipoprotein
MKYLVPSLLVLIAVFVIQGCSPKQASVPLSERIGSATGQIASGGQTTGGDDEIGREGRITEEELAGGGEGQGEMGADGDNLLAPHLQDVFFDFDSYMVRSEDIPILKGIAAWLTDKPKAIITIEGHCDERGTTDYNLALGQRRAEAAKDYLVKMGVNERQIRAVSFGKEAPVDQGHTEEAWQRNRRAHFVAR